MMLNLKNNKKYYNLKQCIDLNKQVVSKNVKSGRKIFIKGREAFMLGVLKENTSKHSPFQEVKINRLLLNKTTQELSILDRSMCYDLTLCDIIKKINKRGEGYSYKIQGRVTVY